MKWLLRPIVWFPAAYTIVIIVHEASHALTAVALGFRSRLFNFWVDHDFTGATAAQRAIVGAAGPIASLIVGFVCWLLYRKFKSSRAGLPLLYLAASGVANFFGNLMSAAFIGDFSNAALVLGLSLPVRYAISLTGAVAVAVVVFATGRELRQWTPAYVSGIGPALAITIVPVLVGTAIIIITNQPTPMGPSFVSARLVEGSLWIFAVAGALSASARHAQPGDESRLRLHWIDAVSAVIVVSVVRIMAGGILLTP